MTKHPAEDHTEQAGTRAEAEASTQHAAEPGARHRADAGTAARREQTVERFAGGRATAAVHAGYHPDPHVGAINPPIYASTTFAQDDVAVLRGGFEYSRCGNPTVAALEKTVAALEGGRWARAFGSGMAATDTLLRAVLRPGDHVVLGNDAYGGTFRLIDSTFTHWGVSYSVVDTTDAAQVAAALRERTKLVWIETPTNPLLGITDIAAVAEAISHHPALLAVDNTFASPYLQRPLDLGADVVVHSTTKYLGGHSDVVGGLIITSHQEVDEEVLFLQGGVGAVPSAFDAYLTHRGIKTLPVRMRQHCENAQAIAERLAGDPAVSQVLYPGLQDHPGHAVAAKQMDGFGGMVSVRFAGGEPAALRFCRATRLICLAESLGGVESLLEHPARMTHQSAAGSALEVPADLVRISVGIEDAADLLADVDQALAQLG